MGERRGQRGGKHTGLELWWCFGEPCTVQLGAGLSGGSERTQRGTWHFVFTLEGVELVVCNQRDLNGGSRWGMISSASEKPVVRGGRGPELWTGRPAAVLPLAVVLSFGSNEWE